MDTPSTSAAGSVLKILIEDKEIDEKQQQIKEKGQLTNALLYCTNQLKNKDLISDTPPDKISSVSIAMGEEIYKNILYMIGDRKIITDEDLIAFNESDEDASYEECTENVESDEYMPDEFEPTFEYIPLSYKQKTVALAEAHPKWSLKTLHRQGCARLKNMQRLKTWKEDVKRGGTKFDKWKYIETETFERFIEARESLQQVTTRTLQQWAMSAAFPFLSEEFIFNASKKWVNRFKRKYRIKQQSITRYVSSHDCATLEETMKAAERFQIQTRAIIPDFELDYVINTDQTDCQYQMIYNRTLAEQETKTVLVKKKSLNTLTHSYTAQYTLTASGKILPFVFLCMQEPKGKFSPSVKKCVTKLMNDFENVIVTCSKSGKLTKEIYKEFLTSTLSPYVRKNKFLLIIDSWEGQTDPTLYDNIFEDEIGRASCTIKVIPPKCTSICQPSDVYFYRQVKNFIKRLQNAPALLREKREIATREDAIKIQSLLLHQLSAPIFNSMIRYAWYASKLINDRPTFLNINEVCFSSIVIQKPCSCRDIAIIKCAWCESLLCFKCFYDDYHPSLCKNSQCEQDVEIDIMT